MLLKKNEQGEVSENYKVKLFNPKLFEQFNPKLFDIKTLQIVSKKTRGANVALGTTIFLKV